MGQNAAGLPKARKVAAMSTPTLVATRRSLYLAVAKQKLLGGNTATQEQTLQAIDEELTRRNITIHHPELL